MIRNEAEYQKAVRRIVDEQKRLEEHRNSLNEAGLTEEQRQRVLDPIESFHLQLKEEIESYERLRRGDFDELLNLHGLGITLIGLRIALGLSQRAFAGRLGVSETQVSRDERNEYHGITVDRATQILDTLGVRLTSQFAEPVLGDPAPPQPEFEPDTEAVA
jgi:ribosome-binding protein aMBF1 (putative translation factor)